jgi:uncharacterized membrane protein YdjX (TVP38/TMEM64 family)
MERTYERIARNFGKLTTLQKMGAVLATLGVIALGIGFLVLTGKVFEWLEPVAADWENSKVAYFIVWICTFIISFPPLVGWSTIGTIAGFIFGMWKGYVFSFLSSSTSVLTGC